MEDRSVIIIQARTGSSRLPGKVLKPFYGNLSVLDIIINTCKASTDGGKVIVATASGSGDDAVEECAKRNGIPCFRGDENDVLKRFIDAAEHFNTDRIIRVCADNPLLDGDLLDHLISVSKNHNADYCSFEVAPGIPAIRSHWGIFAEFVTLPALKRVVELTDEAFWHEHVTNYLYSNPDLFRLNWIKAPESIYGRTDIRFTIDTEEDFVLIQQVYADLVSKGINPNFKDAIRLVDSRPDWKEIMKRQIERFSK